MGAPLDADTVARLRAAWLRNGILVFPRQTALTPERHIEFTRHFGEPVSITLKQYDLPDYPEIVVVSNLKKDGKPVGVPLAYTWHTDGQRFREPVWGSLLWGKEVPPETGRKALYLKGNAGWEIVGMPRDEGLALLDELEAFATRPERVYAHHWKQGDAVFWDNRCTMHSATPYDMTRHRRVMHRTTIVGDVPF